jgi:hypothetical protein
MNIIISNYKYNICKLKKLFQKFINKIDFLNFLLILLNAAFVFGSVKCFNFLTILFSVASLKWVNHTLSQNTKN